MCGRFTLRTNPAAWCQQFLPEMEPLPQLESEFRPRYNIAPTQNILAVLRQSTGQAGELLRLRWGLVPSWAKDLAIGNRMINARSETVEEKPSFRKAFQQRRCLVIADGYYEWKKTQQGKQPYLIESNGSDVFAFAGLWEVNTRLADAGSELRTCTIITTSANQATRSLHDRMPVILEPEDYDRWLDPGFRETDELKRMLQPAAEDLLKLTPVSRRVNNPRNDDEACLAAAAVDEQD